MKKIVMTVVCAFILNAGANMVFHEDFESYTVGEALPTASSQWFTALGNPFTVMDVSGDKAADAPTGTAIATVQDESFWLTSGQDLLITNTFTQVGAGQDFGLVFNYSSSANQYIFILNRASGIAKLSKKVDGVLSVIYSETFVNSGAGTMVLSYTAATDTISVDVTQGALHFSKSIVDSSLDSGTIGLYAGGTSNYQVRDIYASAIPEPATIGMLGLASIFILLVRRMRYS